MTDVLWRPATREVRLTGGRDSAATAAWAAARRRPRNGATRVSPSSGWHLWVECGGCHTAYALRPSAGHTDLAEAGYARWVTACAGCGRDVVLWTGGRWHEEDVLSLP